MGLQSWLIYVNVVSNRGGQSHKVLSIQVILRQIGESEHHWTFTKSTSDWQNVSTLSEASWVTVKCFGQGVRWGALRAQLVWVCSTGQQWESKKNLHQTKQVWICVSTLDEIQVVLRLKNESLLTFYVIRPSVFKEILKRCILYLSYREVFIYVTDCRYKVPHIDIERYSITC